MLGQMPTTQAGADIKDPIETKNDAWHKLTATPKDNEADHAESCTGTDGKLYYWKTLGAEDKAGGKFFNGKYGLTMAKKARDDDVTDKYELKADVWAQNTKLTVAASGGTAQNLSEIATYWRKW